MINTARHIKFASSFEEINPSVFKDSLYLPDNKFPPRVFYEDNVRTIVGYFVSYEDIFNFNQAVNFIKDGVFIKLVEFNADFLIIIYDNSTKDIKIVTDNCSKFALYFSFRDGRLSFTTDFGIAIKQIDCPHLDLNGALDFISINDLLTSGPDTIIKEIKKLPPASLLTINQSGYKVKALYNITNLYSQKDNNRKYSTIEDFRKELIQTLRLSTLSRLKETQFIDYATDITSGLDSSLISFLVNSSGMKQAVAHSVVLKYCVDDSNPQIIDKFVNKHNFSVEYLYYDGDKALTDTEMEWVSQRFYPFSKEITVLDLHLKSIKRNNTVFALFDGGGGNEIYQSYSNSAYNDDRFQIQYGYYNSVLKPIHLDKISVLLTDTGITDLMDENRFAEKELFPTPFPPSLVNGTSSAFSLYWENEIWPIKPFVDTRVIALFKHIPRKGEGFPRKLDVWKTDTEIFLKEQLKPKVSLAIYSELYLRSKRDLIVRTLQNSLLEKYKWLRTTEIIDNLTSGNISLYTNEAVSQFLRRYVRLAHFLQTNTIILP